jgi:hypothetical protein
METKSQLVIALKDLTNKLNQATLLIDQTEENQQILVDFSEIKLLNQKITDTVAVLKYLHKNKEADAPIDQTEETIQKQSEVEILEPVFETIPETEIEEAAEIDNTSQTEQNQEEEEEEEEEEEDTILNQVKRTDEALADKFMNKGITNLSSAIGISEKFMFIHELFKGDTEEYIKTLNNLNNCANLIDANQAIEKLSNEMSWDEKTSAFQELNNILARKYPA